MELEELSHSPGHTDDFYNKKNVRRRIRGAKKHKQEIYGAEAKVSRAKVSELGHNEKLVLNSICKWIFGTFEWRLKVFHTTRINFESETLPTNFLRQTIVM